jgi:hypothetical protein
LKKRLPRFQPQPHLQPIVLLMCSTMLAAIFSHLFPSNMIHNPVLNGSGAASIAVARADSK